MIVEGTDALGLVMFPRLALHRKTLVIKYRGKLLRGQDMSLGGNFPSVVHMLVF